MIVYMNKNSLIFSIVPEKFTTQKQLIQTYIAIEMDIFTIWLYIHQTPRSALKRTNHLLLLDTWETMI